MVFSFPQTAVSKFGRGLFLATFELGYLQLTKISQCALVLLPTMALSYNELAEQNRFLLNRLMPFAKLKLIFNDQI